MSLQIHAFLVTHLIKFLQPFTLDLPRGNIYEMILPDLLHQLIKEHLRTIL
jgi:hypothetical protein